MKRKRIGRKRWVATGTRNSIAKFLSDRAKYIPPDIAEDYYRYTKSILGIGSNNTELRYDT